MRAAVIGFADSSHMNSPPCENYFKFNGFVGTEQMEGILGKIKRVA
jgi:hypothetical protein